MIIPILVVPLIVVTGSLLRPHSAAASETFTVPAAADAYINRFEPDRSYGASSALKVSPNSYRTFLRFPPPSLPTGSTVTGVSLTIFATGTEAGGFEVHPASAAWTEANLTYNSAPAWNTTVLGRSANLRADTWMTISLPTSVLTGSSLDLAVSASSPILGHAASRETTTKPQLVLTFERTGTSATPAVTSAAAPIPAPVATPSATVETTDVPVGGADSDVSDDSAVWLDKARPTNSVVIGDDKSQSSGGIAVYDMGGRMLQYRQDGMIGNVDLRDGFMLGGRSVVLVGANNRTTNTMVFYTLDPATRRLTPVRAGALPTVSPNYGFCMYHSRTNKFYAFVTPYERGTVEQYELLDKGGALEAVKVRSLLANSKSESCVADDELGRLYVAEEDVAIWNYSAEPTGGSARAAVDRVGDGHLVADIEGLTLSYGPDGGYLFASSQGNSTFAVYRRGANSFVRSFSVTGSGTVDSVSGTDGIDAVLGNFGPGFEDGIFVAHDGSNRDGSSSNLKYVPLRQIVGGSAGAAPPAVPSLSPLAPTPSVAPSTTKPPPTPSATATPTPPPPTSTASTTTATVGTPAPRGPTGKWSIVFQDEFNGTSLDRTKWIALNNWRMNNVTAYSSNVAVANGNLILTLASSTSGAFVSSASWDGAGANSYSFPVGDYTEARVYFPGSATQPIYNWPAWWTSGPSWPAAGEHDVAEGLGGELTVNYHSPSGAHNQGAVSGQWSNGFHTYGVHRLATRADVYWDGVLVRSYPTDDNGAAEALLLNVGASTSRAAVTGAAGQVRVDYVRAWRPGG